MATVDLSKLSFTDLQKVAAETQRLLDDKREEELKTLVDGWAKKAASNGFSPVEVIEAFKAYLPRRRKGRAAKAKRPDGPKATAGATYKHPDTGETWTFGGRGRTVGWLKDLVAGGKSFGDFQVKK